jgi:hypothetical protein
MRTPHILLLQKPQRPPASVMSLFANGEQGVVWLPNFTKFMFQDAAMTIPAVVGMPVVKQLDLSGRGNHRTLTNVTLQQDEAGRKYLLANGTSSTGVTAAIDFTGTDKMTVFAAIYKASDAATAAFLELSATANTNNGSFNILAPASAGSTVASYLRGDTAINVNNITGVAAPIKYVHTGLFDIAQATAAAESVVRINGAASASTGSASGAGNFGNYVLYSFARGGTQLYFSGRDYGTIARGATCGAGQVADVERYLAGLSGLAF